MTERACACAGEHAGADLRQRAAEVRRAPDVPARKAHHEEGQFCGDLQRRRVAGHLLDPFFVRWARSPAMFVAIASFFKFQEIRSAAALQQEKARQTVMQGWWMVDAHAWM